MTENNNTHVLGVPESEQAVSQAPPLPNCGTMQFGVCETVDDLAGISLSIPQTGDGRRLYIHEKSFEQLAMQGINAAYSVYASLVAVPVVKLVYHEIAEDAVLLGEFSLRNSRALSLAVTKRWFGSLTSVLQSIGYRPSNPQQRSNFLPLLSRDETIVATCFDANYFTFATSEQAAQRMYADVLEMSHVRQMLSTHNPAYMDLTLVKGKALAVIDPVIGTGESLAQCYLSAWDSQNPLSLSDLHLIKSKILSEFEEELELVISQAISNPTSQEKARIHQFHEKCLAVVSQVILRL